MPTVPTTTFHNLGISESLLTCLTRLNFTTPTPIQQKAIPIASEGNDVIGIAQTGTGKTLAFSIPMVQQILANKTQGLVLVPTRELAFQVHETLQKIGRSFSLHTAVLIGGEPMFRQIKDIRLKPHIIVATPGRLIDHLEQKNLSLSQIGVLVLDEADRMLDMGFEPQIKRILSVVPQKRQTMLFSATMPEKIGRIAKTYMKQPLQVEVAPAGTTAENVEQEVFIVPRNQKIELLDKLLLEYQGTALVFMRTKHGAKKLARIVNRLGHPTAELHSNRSQGQRKEAMSGFRSGKYRVLIATDIVARGIDVTGIEVVINYDLPDNSEDYVHRIGRTARAGRTGKAISFVCPEQKRDLQSIERLIRTRLNITPLPTLEKRELLPDTASYSSREESGQGGRREGGFFRGRGRGRGGRSSGNNFNRRRQSGR